MAIEAAPESQSSSEGSPVVWDDPADARLNWQWDRWHAPDPLPPLSFDINALFVAGFRRGQAAVGTPTRQLRRHINGYLYQGQRAVRDDDPLPIGTDPQPTQDDNHRHWDEVWLPQLQSYAERWRAFDRERSDAAELLAHIDESTLWFQHFGEIHFRLDHRGRWESWAQSALDLSPGDARQLVLGEWNKSTEGDAALRDLAFMVQASPSLTAAFDRPAAEVLDAVTADAHGAAFRAALARFLEEFGRRSDIPSQTWTPSWIEDPLPVIALVKMSAARPAGDYEAARAELLEQRNSTVDAVRARFVATAPERAAEFDDELARGRRGVVLSEDHNYWIEQPGYFWSRMNFLAAGRLLQMSGVIASRDDVFYLYLSEVRQGLLGALGPMQSVVEERRRQRERWRAASPPAELGAPMPPEAAVGSELTLGGVGAHDGLQLRGQPGSRGVVTGRARVLRSLDEADRLSPGEVLVARTTLPPWTALFGVAAAIVTDAGGALSHAAVVAREYGIPAVVATGTATARIRDGQMIRVDGTAGTVDLLDGE